VPAPLREPPPGTIVEIGPAALALAAALARRLAQFTGAALVIDYGDVPRPASATLRAVRAHRPVGVLEAPGSADLSADVDFDSLAEAARAAGADVYGPVPQGDFLRSLGAEARLAALCAAPGAHHAVLASGVRRLIDPDKMGNLFKAMAIVSPGLPSPAGFAAENGLPGNGERA
jgi:SAM-dependent MidA family methyltransferase